MMDSLEEKIGYKFNNIKLLETAMTHSSYANEHHSEGVECYERLEFLGDSILSLVTAEFLYSHEPPLPEGRMTKLRAELVCEVSLHKTALMLGLGEYMRLGKGEEHTGGRARVSVLADMVEAIIAAIYLDSGIDEAKKFIMGNILRDVEISSQHRDTDYKTALQEFVQRAGAVSIKYESVSEKGPDHCKVFTFAVYINGVYKGEGSGRTKKEAEQMAAAKALEGLLK